MRIIYLLPVIMTIVLQSLHGQDKPIVLKGGMLIDVEDYGKSANDISNAIVVIQHGKIIAAGANGKGKLIDGPALLKK